MNKNCSVRKDNMNELMLQLQTEKDSAKLESLWNEMYKACKKLILKCSSSKNFQFNPCWEDEDLVQDVMLSLFQSHMQYDPNRASCATWLSKIGMNRYRKCYNRAFTLCINEAGEEEKKKKLDTTSFYIEGEDGEINLVDLYYSAPSAEDEYFNKEFAEMLYREMEKLPERDRDVIRLCDINGYKPAKAAQILGCESRDVSRWLNRAHAKLRRIVESEREKEACDMDFAA